MFSIDSDQTIHLTRGDVAVIEINAMTLSDTEYVFKVGDVVRFKVIERKRYDLIIVQKDVVVEAESPVVEVRLDSDDTRVGDLIHKPLDYWYEVELNPETHPQTIIGYDANGPKIFRLYPEGDDY